MLNELGEGPRPYLYVIVATGNIFEDVVQAQAAARQGADIIAVIRTTGQSLLDYVPYGATTEGFGGTFATTGTGSVQPGGFDISYQYPDSLFINRWRMDQVGLRWEITARDAKGKEAPFAAYIMTRAACP